HEGRTFTMQDALAAMMAELGGTSAQHRADAQALLFDELLRSPVDALLRIRADAEAALQHLRSANLLDVTPMELSLRLEPGIRPASVPEASAESAHLLLELATRSGMTLRRFLEALAARETNIDFRK